MLNPKRGFRRLFLVLSVVWAVGSGFYLWRLAPHAVTETKGKPIVEWDEKGNPIPSPPPGTVDEYIIPLGDFEYAVMAGSEQEARQKAMLAHVRAAIPTRQQVVDAIADLTTEQQLRILKLLEPTILAARSLQATPKPQATDSQLRSWLAIGLVPPMIAFALLESLLWAVRGFLGDKTK